MFFVDQNLPQLDVMNCWSHLDALRYPTVAVVRSSVQGALTKHTKFSFKILIRKNDIFDQIYFTTHDNRLKSH